MASGYYTRMGIGVVIMLTLWLVGVRSKDRIFFHLSHNEIMDSGLYVLQAKQISVGSTCLQEFFSSQTLRLQIPPIDAMHKLCKWLVKLSYLKRHPTSTLEWFVIHSAPWQKHRCLGGSMLQPHGTYVCDIGQ